MPLPVSAPDTSLLRFSLLYRSVPHPLAPGVANDLTITREPAPNSEAGAFYYRDKPAGTFTLTGADYQLLWAIENSTARCEELGLLVEHRGSVALPWESLRLAFTCNDCAFNTANCSATFTPTLADEYRGLLDNWDKEYNILLTTPLDRRTVSAQLGSLAANITIEFLRVAKETQGDYIGTDGWALFYLNNSSIYRGTGLGFQDNNDAMLFRYRQTYKLGEPIKESNPPRWLILDRSRDGWTPLFPIGVAQGGNSVNTPTLDYVKPPAIAGFKSYVLAGSGINTPFLRTEGDGPGRGTYIYGSTTRSGSIITNGQLSFNPPPIPGGYLGEFLSLNVGKYPRDYGLLDSDYVSISATAGMLNAREEVDDDNQRWLYWKFGEFQFGRCFRLIDGMYSLLSQTVLPFGGAALLPPKAEMLSDFLTNLTNPATGETGDANELPRLLLCAGSDLKRFNSTEAATRLLISFKQFITDLSYLYDGGWFVDPATGYLRFENRAYLQQQRGTGGAFDARTLEDPVLPGTYSYRSQQLARYEELGIANAKTEDLDAEVYFAKSSLDYGTGACVNNREGSNRTAYSVGRLTGDVAAGILESDSIPDNALFILAPDVANRLPRANRELAASQLLYRYYRRGRSAFGATIEGPAPATAPNTVTGELPMTGVPALIDTVRPTREQATISGRLASLASLAPTATYLTNLTQDGELAKAVLNLHTREVKLTVLLPGQLVLADPPEAGGRQFDDSFPDSFL